ncbi:MAG: metal-dependent hydrolase [Candidatus Woesearchaeota archaeon]
MALAVTHVIGAIVILDIIRHYFFSKKTFPRYLLIIGGIVALAPDLDIPLAWIINLISSSKIYIHGTFTHSFMWVFLFVGIGLIFHHYKNMRWAKIFYVIAAGWFIHLGFDWIFGDYKTLFWPFATPEFIFPVFKLSDYSTRIDAVILILWLVHEELHHKIKDYF